jgi:hypothetical protein
MRRVISARNVLGYRPDRLKGKCPARVHATVQICSVSRRIAVAEKAGRVNHFHPKLALDAL